MAKHILNKFFRTLDVAASAGTLTTDRFSGTLGHIIIRAASSSTGFDVAIKDKTLGFVIYQRTDVAFEINEEVRLPVKGDYEVIISSADAAEEFRVYLAVEES